MMSNMNEQDLKEITSRTNDAREDVPDLVARVRVLFAALKAAARYIDRSKDILSSPSEVERAEAEYKAAVELTMDPPC